MPEAKSVWMYIEKDDGTYQYAKMSQDTTHPRLWFATCSVRHGRLYYYGAKLSAWFGLKADKIYEEGRRIIQKNSAHRDIFTSVEKKTTGFSDRNDGCKFFFEQTVNTIRTEETCGDLQALLNEYFQLDHSCLRHTDQHELGRFATECASKVVSNPFAAAFVIYYLSRIYDKAESMRFSNIQQSDALCLLNALRNWPLQQFLGTHFSHSITETMFYLVKVCRKSNTWDSFALWCYPSLSSSEILSVFEPTECYPTTELVKSLCSCVGRCEGAQQILSAICSRINSLSALSQVVETFSQSDMQGCLEKIRPYFVNHVKAHLDKLYVTSHLKELSEVASHISSVDCLSMSEVLPTFEEKLLEILSRKEDASQYKQHLEKVILNPVVFTDRHQTVKLFQIFAGSLQRLHHILLPSLLQSQKFSMLLDDETVAQVIDQWLGVVGNFTSFSTSEPKSLLRDLHTHIFQMTKLHADLLKSVHVKKEIHKKCIKTFFHLAVPRITQTPNALHLKVLQELVHEMKGADSELFEQFQEDIEAAITTIVQKASTCDSDHAQILVHLLLHDKLFIEADCSKVVLEYMAVSGEQNIHQVFLKTMTPEKFWKILSAAECERLFNQWLTRAVKYHCMNKAKKRSDYHILYLYEYVADALTISSLKSNETVRNQLETTAKNEFSRYDPKRIMDMLDSAASRIKEDAVELLELHLQHAEIKNLMSKREYHSALAKLMESEGQDWKLKQRYYILVNVM